MADESEHSVGEAESEVPASVSRLMEQLDSQWEQRFEALSNLLKRSLPDDRSCDDQNPKRQEMTQCQSHSHSQSNVLTVQDGELDDEEDKLCNPSANPDGTSDQTSLLQDIKSKFTVEEKLGGKLKDDLANVRFRSKLSDEMLNKRFDFHKTGELH